MYVCSIFLAGDVIHAYHPPPRAFPSTSYTPHLFSPARDVYIVIIVNLSGWLAGWLGVRVKGGGGEGNQGTDIKCEVGGRGASGMIMRYGYCI